MTKVFGVPLSEVCESENLPIPRVTEEIFKYLEEKGMFFFFFLVNMVVLVYLDLF